VFMSPPLFAASLCAGRTHRQANAGRAGFDDVVYSRIPSFQPTLIDLNASDLKRPSRITTRSSSTRQEAKPHIPWWSRKDFPSGTYWLAT